MSCDSTQLYSVLPLFLRRSLLEPWRCSLRATRGLNGCNADANLLMFSVSTGVLCMYETAFIPHEALQVRERGEGIPRGGINNKIKRQ